MAEPPELGTNCEDSKAKRQPERPQMLSRVLHSDREPVSVSSTQISDDSSDQKGLGRLILSSPVEVMDRLSLLEPIVHLAFEITALFLPDRHADPVDRPRWVVMSRSSQQGDMSAWLVSGSTRRPPITGVPTPNSNPLPTTHTHTETPMHTYLRSVQQSTAWKLQHRSTALLHRRLRLMHRGGHCWSA